MKLKAFTLAKTLITLGIIGIVAALTLPALIQKQHKKDLEVAFTKSYASLQTAIMSFHRIPTPRYLAIYLDKVHYFLTIYSASIKS